jgi:hypothetical protein
MGLQRDERMLLNWLGLRTYSMKRTAPLCKKGIWAFSKTLHIPSDLRLHSTSLESRSRDGSSRTSDSRPVETPSQQQPLLRDYAPWDVPLVLLSEYPAQLLSQAEVVSRMAVPVYVNRVFVALDELRALGKRWFKSSNS